MSSTSKAFVEAFQKIDQEQIKQLRGWKFGPINVGPREKNCGHLCYISESAECCLCIKNQSTCYICGLHQKLRARSN
jgi:hypothetical protein